MFAHRMFGAIGISGLDRVDQLNMLQLGACDITGQNAPPGQHAHELIGFEHFNQARRPRQLGDAQMERRIEAVDLLRFGI